jgi:auxin efflux carrier family protein
LKGLHWDKIPGDNDDEVAARGILYLLIFQQLGQLVRWSWGYHVLLAPPEKYDEAQDNGNSQVEQGRIGYTDTDDYGEYEDSSVSPTSDETQSLLKKGSREDFIRDARKEDIRRVDGSFSRTESLFESGGQTPVTPFQYPSSATSSASISREGSVQTGLAPGLLATPTGTSTLPANASSGHITSFPSIRSPTPGREQNDQASIKRWFFRTRAIVSNTLRTAVNRISALFGQFSTWLPKPMRGVLSKSSILAHRFLMGLWEFMNPPLWAMLAAIVVASIPSLQRLLFTEGTFLSNSATRAVSQSGGVAIPLILVVLGANLARNTLPGDPHRTIEHEKEETKLLVASLVSRMLLPTIVMAPILALGAKYIPISILDDPIFVIVCFLLTGAPSALQLAQICQINGVYEGVMSRLLFQSYVIW